ncbi:hypothetical protein Hte_005308 [Hypoxylon texense]
MAPTRPRRAVERLPTEVIVKMFCIAESAADVRALLLTSTRFHSAFLGSENHVAKAPIMRLLDRDNYKLGRHGRPRRTGSAPSTRPPSSGSSKDHTSAATDGVWSCSGCAPPPRLLPGSSGPSIVWSEEAEARGFTMRRRDFDPGTPAEHAGEVRAFLHARHRRKPFFRCRPGSPPETWWWW